MTVSVPDEEKTYTTVYDHFKGVDYTNDASNVYKRRSPSGLNMLPDLDGRPYKRTGWEIAVTAEQFCEAAGVETQEVIPERIHHFVIGGTEYLMIFNSVGVFYMTDSEGPVRCKIYDEDLTPENYSVFPPEDATPQMPADANRSFYFEGNGLAGFYTFVGLDLYRFDGAYYNKVDPHIPVIVDGATPATGNGTSAEDVNMLTEKRSMQYFGDGTRIYTLLERPDTDSIVVEIKGSDGEWQPVPTTDYVIGGSQITFNEGKAPASATEANVRITYEPVNGNTLTIDYVDSSAVAVTSYYNRRRTRTKTVVERFIVHSSGKTERKTSETISGWSSYTVTKNSGTSGTIKLPNLFSSSEIVLKDNLPTGTWHNSDARTLKKTWGTYNASITVTATGLAAENYGHQAAKGVEVTKTSEWVKQSHSEKTTGNITTITVVYRQNQDVMRTKAFSVKVYYPKYTITGTTKLNYESRDAFMTCRKAMNFGNGLYNQMFLSSATAEGFKSRAWFCEKNDPSYFPDTGYIEVGAEDTGVVGMTKSGSYLVFVKAGSGTDSSIYFAYATTFDDIYTFAVKQGFNGIGAISNGAFNLMNGEPLFLSEEGIVAIEISSEETDRRVRNRSWYVNRKLHDEPFLDSAVSYVHKGMYFLAVNNHCYVLDGSQKTSWENEKTNLQYECYYLENVPAQCFAGMDDRLYFVDFKGNLCRFKSEFDALPFRDQYSVSDPKHKTTLSPTDDTFTFDDLSPSTDFAIGDTVATYVYDSETQAETMTDWYTITNVDTTGRTVSVTSGVPIPARWSTIADDDGTVHFFKNLKKKGSLVSLLPASNSGVLVYLKPDEKDAIFVGESDADNHTLPFEFYTKKKIKKYKRLQIICENNKLDESFGIDQIIKTYTVGNYSKNKK